MGADGAGLQAVGQEASKRTMKSRRTKFHVMKLIVLGWVGLSACAVCSAADLTGNWLAAESRGDGTFRRSYFSLKQQDGKITGTVRITQSFYSIVEGSGGPDGFTIVVRQGDSERR